MVQCAVGGEGRRVMAKSKAKEKPAWVPEPGEFVAYTDREVHADPLLGVLEFWLDSEHDAAIVKLRNDAYGRRVIRHCLSQVNQPRFKRGEPVKVYVHSSEHVSLGGYMKGLVCELTNTRLFSCASPPVQYEYKVWVDSMGATIEADEKNIVADAEKGT